ncbi:hypothetical protein NDU88_004609 [Pleurodeles waltl]|uniref:Uncharacterized protein n=1 Tax=Pleurodeles waltl TaxID=8319 RepID=A0AAV7SJE3_PLEWA|nr:hypothetical protein NDU88_004609 [Pleurodeles waltl]
MRDRGSERDHPREPLLSKIMATIPDLEGSLEPRLDAVAIDVGLFRADLQKVSDKVSTAPAQGQNEALYDLRALAERQARAFALASQCRLYDVGDKAGRLLAWLDKLDQERSWVRTMRNKEGTDCGSSESIVEAFAAYYEEVYA